MILVLVYWNILGSGIQHILTLKYVSKCLKNSLFKNVRLKFLFNIKNFLKKQKTLETIHEYLQ